MNRAASAAQLPTTAGGATTSAGPSPVVLGEVRQHGGCLAEAHVEREQPPRSTASRKPSQPEASAWYVRSLPTKPSGSEGTSRRPTRPAEHLGPSRRLDHVRSPNCRPRARPRAAGSRPRSAASWWPARPARRPPPSNRPDRAPPNGHATARAAGLRRRVVATSAAVSSTSSNTADHCTLLNCLAPTAASFAGSTNMRRPRFGLRATTQAPGPRTRPPRATRRFASSAPTPLRCLDTPDRGAAPARAAFGDNRSRRASLSATGRVDLVANRATSTSTSPRCLRVRVRTRTTPPLRSGGSSWTTSLGRGGLVIDLVQRWRRSLTSAPAPAEATNLEPSSRVIMDSPTFAAVRTFGGGAGSSSIPAACVTTVCTTAPMNSVTSVRDATEGGAMTWTGSGHDRRPPVQRRVASSAARHRTAMSTARSPRLVDAASAPQHLGRPVEPRPPPPSRATARSRTPSPSSPPPTATSQPSASATGIETASARWPSGSSTPAVHAPAERGSTECLEPVGELVVVRGRPRGPAARTTISPSDHDACSGTPSPSSSSVSSSKSSSSGPGPGLAGVEAVVHPVQPFELVGEVGDHLVAFGSRQPVDRLETALRIGKERVEDCPTPHAGRHR